MQSRSSALKMSFKQWWPVASTDRDVCSGVGGRAPVSVAPESGNRRRQLCGTVVEAVWGTQRVPAHTQRTRAPLLELCEEEPGQQPLATKRSKGTVVVCHPLLKIGARAMEKAHSFARQNRHAQGAGLAEREVESEGR